MASTASPMMPSVWYLRLSLLVVAVAGRTVRRRRDAGTSSAPCGLSDESEADCSLTAGTTGEEENDDDDDEGDDDVDSDGDDAVLTGALFDDETGAAADAVESPDADDESAVDPCVTVNALS